ncbi:unnamed protein product [Dovyalis caffra]|uniref:Uncharacterized protein n=1 Tax=Dovyalis caffra TaxID=77055 RepID=A0AAV1SSJ5_9ROSI|nr:unnamed protein product [Dovyalis caffra]
MESQVWEGRRRSEWMYHEVGRVVEKVKTQEKGEHGNHKVWVEGMVGKEGGNGMYNDTHSLIDLTKDGEETRDGEEMRSSNNHKHTENVHSPFLS